MSECIHGVYTKNICYECEHKNLVLHLELSLKEITALESKLSQSVEGEKKLRELLLEIGSTTHKSKKLYEWYCENKITEQNESMES